MLRCPSWRQKRAAAEVCGAAGGCREGWMQGSAPAIGGCWGCFGAASWRLRCSRGDALPCATRAQGIEHFRPETFQISEKYPLLGCVEDKPVACDLAELSGARIDPQPVLALKWTAGEEQADGSPAARQGDGLADGESGAAILPSVLWPVFGREQKSLERRETEQTCYSSAGENSWSIKGAKHMNF